MGKLKEQIVENEEAKKTSKRGGYRPGSGRKANDRKVPLLVRITPEAADKLARLTSNKAEYIDRLIKELPD